MYFISDNFLLETELAQSLYHNVSKPLPIIDYHNHLSVKDIAENRVFKDLTEIWLDGDHYKWRAMRAMGIDEHYITGNASNKEKFDKWAEVVPSTLRNPLYHWSHLELLRYFGIDEYLNPSTSSKIYDQANELLGTDEFTTVSLLTRMNVEVLCTTDDPLDTLEYHENIRVKGQVPFKVLPTWRPDSLLAIHNEAKYRQVLTRLEELTNTTINSLDSLVAAIKDRHDYFHRIGCSLSDHGLNNFPAVSCDAKKAKKAFSDFLDGKALDTQEQSHVQLFLLHEMAIMDYEKSWVQQFHLGSLRNANEGGVERLGVDKGFDTIGDFSQAEGLALFLTQLERTNSLPKTIIYNVNPAHNAVFATMAGSFNDGSEMGKIQWGAPWWFLDQKNGIEEHLDVLSNLGLLRPFVGMLTDSRSLLSFPRHEYFRRILCNVFGNDVQKGLVPNDRSLLEEYISAISYYNAKKYFPF